MKNAQYAKLLLFINSLIPLSILAWDTFLAPTRRPDPATDFLHTTGALALIFLIFSLSITPLRRLTGKNYLSNFRRMLGLYAFFYASLHLGCYIIVKQGGNLTAILRDVASHTFILFGMTAFLVMIPLACTSTIGSIKRLGAKRWKLLHRLAYLAGAAAAIHYYLNGKIVTRLPEAIIILMASLLGFRLAAYAYDKLLKPHLARPTRPAQG